MRCQLVLAHYRAHQPRQSVITRANSASWLQDWMAPSVDIHPSAYDAFAEEEDKFHLVVKCADLISRWFPVICL